jgi:Ca2+-binding RTX toxin-like protein
MRALRLSAIVGLCVFGLGAAFVAPGSRLSASAGRILECDGDEATISGLSGVITGTSGRDVIVGFDGDDVIKGNGGDDVICGGEGDDAISGGSGDDELYGEYRGCQVLGGNDTLRGDSGQDSLEDFCGMNDADGGSGPDRVRGVGTMRGGSGNDVFIFANGDIFNTCGRCFTGLALGGAGDDVILVSRGVADGGSGNDQLTAGDVVTELRGGSGNDQLVDQNSPALTLDGGSGRDVCDGAGGDDAFVSCETAE